MRRIDRHAIEECGLPGRLLMENAGRAIAEAVRRLVPAARRPLVVCGAGNNGGDGFVVARVLREWDGAIRPVVLALGDPARASDEARANFALLMASGVEVVLAGEHKDTDALLTRCDLVIDAVFGVGLSRPVEAEAARVLSSIDGAAAPVLAVDLPSGVSSETGETLGARARADFIVTLGLPKLGLAVRPEAAQISVADIGLPAASVDAADVRQHVWTAASAARYVPPRPPAGHKGSFGHVLVVGGADGKTGAAALAAEGALRAGAGLLTVAAPRSLASVFEAKLLEAMSLHYDDAGAGHLVEAAVPDLQRGAAERDVVVAGPGLGTAAATRTALSELVAGLEAPLVLDADGLNAFAEQPEALRSTTTRVLTPHPGEMARLLGCSNADVQADRIAAARELASRSDAIAVLKGACTVVAHPDGQVLVNPTGGPGLASGGSGDVLAGLIGALLGQGVEPFGAAALGAFVHGRAGERQGEIGLASEVAAAIPTVLAELRAPEGSFDGPGTLRRFP